ncbi:MAG TPA: hypothetical protein PKC30_14895 [Saprospiraceae bacterium]|nr:hypothetical protein [Saprospiraceae bacterium]
MIQTLYQIGNAIKDEPEFQLYFQPWGNPFPGREKEAKVIVAEVVDSKFKKLTIEDFKKNQIGKYLFKLGSTGGRVVSLVPIAS